MVIFCSSVCSFICLSVCLYVCIYVCMFVLVCAYQISLIVLAGIPYIYEKKRKKFGGIVYFQQSHMKMYQNLCFDTIFTKIWKGFHRRIFKWSCLKTLCRVTTIYNTNNYVSQILKTAHSCVVMTVYVYCRGTLSRFVFCNSLSNSFWFNHLNLIGVEKLLFIQV